MIIFRKSKSLFNKILTLIHSIYFNFRVFPFRIACKLPVMMSYKVKLCKYHRNCIVLNENITRYMVRFGTSKAPFVHDGNSTFYCSSDGKLCFNGKADFADGIKLYINGGILRIGTNVYIGANTSIQCEREIDIGDDFLGGWNLNIRDTDGHPVIIDGTKKGFKKAIKIHSHVWIGADATILKGTLIKDNSIVACNSVVAGLITDEPGCLIAGCPAKIKKRAVNWEG